jgi:vitamin B12 transporter
VQQQVINITLKQEERKQLRERPMNIGTQTTADRTNYRPEDYNQGLSVNGNLDKFNYYAFFKQHRDRNF